MELVKVICGIGIAGSLLYGAYIIDHVYFIPGLLVIIIGVLISWVSTFVLYGFGELVDKVGQIDHLVEKNDNIENRVNSIGVVTVKMYQHVQNMNDMITKKQEGLEK